jgi:hypothetical protein
VRTLTHHANREKHHDRQDTNETENDEKKHELFQERQAMKRTTKTLEDDIKLARARGAESLRMMRMAFAQALDAGEECAERYEANDDLVLQAECLSRAMTHVCSSLMPRLRLDTAADAQAALLVAAAREATA